MIIESFKSWIDDHHWKTPVVARLLGVQANAVRKWLTGKTVPSYKIMREIAQVTNGAVMPCHFYGVQCPYRALLERQQQHPPFIDKTAEKPTEAPRETVAR